MMWYGCPHWQFGLGAIVVVFVISYGIHMSL